jgi:hypothetical protein
LGNNEIGRKRKGETMLLHLGGDWAANSRRIIAILDYGSVAGSRATKKILGQADKNGLLERIDEDSETRSVIMLETEQGTRLVLSPISAAALKGRLLSNALYLDFAGGNALPAKANRKGR